MTGLKEGGEDGRQRRERTRTAGEDSVEEGLYTRHGRERARERQMHVINPTSSPPHHLSGFALLQDATDGVEGRTESYRRVPCLNSFAQRQFVVLVELAEAPSARIRPDFRSVAVATLDAGFVLVFLSFQSMSTVR